jgi:hypothetical protein
MDGHEAGNYQAKTSTIILYLFANLTFHIFQCQRYTSDTCETFHGCFNLRVPLLDSVLKMEFSGYFATSKL